MRIDLVNLRKHRWVGQVLRAGLALALVLSTFSPLMPIPRAYAALNFTVNSIADEHDLSPTDGFCQSTPSGVCTLRAAVEETFDDGGNNTIDIPNNTYNLTLGEINFTSIGSYTVTGTGGVPVIVAQANNRVFSVPITGTVALVNLTVQGNGTVSGAGGCILNSGTLTLDGVTVLGCTASTASGAGGGIYSDGSLGLTGSTIHDNVALGGNGGGVYQADSLTVNGGSFYNNWSNANGGGLFVGLDLTTAGSAPDFGSSGGNVSNHDAAGLNEHGGGAYVARNANLAAGGVFANNQALGPALNPNNSGGGLYVAGQLDASGATFTSNTAPSDGGGAWAGSAGTLATSDFNDNVCSYAGCHGGGLFVADTLGGFTLNDVDFNGNDSQGDGGGTYGAGSVTLGTNASPPGSRSDFVGNICHDTDCRGAGLFVGNSLTGDGFTFDNNWAQASGGGAYVTHVATLHNGSFSNNLSGDARPPTTGGQGGGLYTGEDMTLEAIDFTSNTSYDDGGGAYTPNSADVVGGSFVSNLCTYSLCWGGGIHTGDITVPDSDEVPGQSYHLNMARTVLRSNTAQSDGGGAYALGPAHLTDCAFTTNDSVNGSGGGIITYRTLTVDATKATSFDGNQAKVRGGGAYSEEQADVRDTRFTSNACTGGGCLGGGLYAFNDLVMRRTTFDANTALAYGGGLYLYGTGDIQDSDWHDNSTTESTSRGGGVYARETVAMARVEFIHNTTHTEGGGLYMLGWVNGNSSIVNALFTRNSATTGDALYLYPTTGRGGAMTVRYATVANPSATPYRPADHQAIYLASGSLDINHSLIAEQATGLQIAGASSAVENFNIWTHAPKVDSSTGSITSGLRIWTDKNLAFANPAGDDYHLTPPSWAIDRGTDLTVVDDLDNALRPARPVPASPEVTWPDLGAYESNYYIDLAITKSANMPVEDLHQPLTYTIVFSQAGTGGVATEVVISDILPIKMANLHVYVSGDVTLTRTSGITYQWTTPEIALGQGGVITITSIALSGGCPVINTAQITDTTSGDYDPVPDNDIFTDSSICIKSYSYLPIITKGYSTTITTTATMR